MSKLILPTNNYLVVTPKSYYLCNDIKHVICMIRPYCYYLKNTQLNNFNHLISRHIERQDWLLPIKKKQYIKEADIYVIKLTNDEISMFY